MSLCNRILKDLHRIDSAECKTLWLSIYRTPSPKRLGISLQTAMLAQGVQEKELGHSRSIQRQLESVIIDGNAPLTDQHRSRVGSRLVRSWCGANHEVNVLPNGFTYRGTVYRSLSEVARVITGTRWSGPRFFGLNTKEAR